VACRGDTAGALVLSEFAGAATELRQAFLCNPHDPDGVKDALLRAVAAEPAELKRRMRVMQRHLRTHDVAEWARSFLAELGVDEETRSED
jgi:trehalose 6-phosphate synthase